MTAPDPAPDQPPPRPDPQQTYKGNSPHLDKRLGATAMAKKDCSCGYEHGEVIYTDTEDVEESSDG